MSNYFEMTRFKDLYVCKIEVIAN